MTKRKTLKTKVIFSVAVMALVLGLIAISISYITFSSRVDELSETRLMQIADTVSMILDTNKMDSYADMASTTYEAYVRAKGNEGVNTDEYYRQFDFINNAPDYQELLEDLNSIAEANDLYSLYLVRYDRERRICLYIVDSDLSDSHCPAGYIEEMFDSTYDKLAEPGVIFEPYTSRTPEFGYQMTGGYPMYTDDGQIACYAMVDIPVDEIIRERYHYLIRLTAILVILTSVIMILNVRKLNSSLLEPVEEITDAAVSYVDDSKKREEDPEYKTKISRLDIKSKDEIQTLADSIKKMDSDMSIYLNQLKNVTAEKERIGAELSVATNIQASMLPSIFPPFPDRPEFEIYASMNPAKEVGGDFYDIFMVDPQHLAIVVADVSGKGVPAALFMVIGKTLIKDHTEPGEDLGDVFTDVNNILCSSNSEQLFITAYEAVIDLKTGEVNYVNAGHEHPFLMTHGEDGNASYVEMKPKAGMVLAGMEGIKYKSGTFTMKPGDCLFQYTDGVTEATNSALQLYGMERLTRVLNENCELDTKSLISVVTQDIDAFVGEAPQFDDITMLSLKFVQYMQS